jgi:hypothetical protein
MLAKVNPTVQENVGHIPAEETHDHYLGSHIQNQLIPMMAFPMRRTNANVVKIGKYFQLFLTVHLNTEEVKMTGNLTEIFWFNTKLSDSFLAAIDELGLHICNFRGQGYDNGANMKGQVKGIQAHIHHINSRAFVTPCGHCNLALGDAAKCISEAISFFGIIQRIYMIFTVSPNRWQVLRANVPYLPPKTLSATRWEW